MGRRGPPPVPSTRHPDRSRPRSRRRGRALCHVLHGGGCADAAAGGLDVAYLVGNKSRDLSQQVGRAGGVRGAPQIGGRAALVRARLLWGGVARAERPLETGGTHPHAGDRLARSRQRRPLERPGAGGHLSDTRRERRGVVPAGGRATRPPHIRRASGERLSDRSKVGRPTGSPANMSQRCSQLRGQSRSATTLSLRTLTAGSISSLSFGTFSNQPSSG